MKHPHADLINKWLEDTSQEIETYDRFNCRWLEGQISYVCSDIGGCFEYRIKPSDPYAELRKAQKEGKRIVFKDSSGEWVDQIKEIDFEFNYPPEMYKIVDRDNVYEFTVGTDFGIVYVEITKSGIDGKVTAKVVK